MKESLLSQALKIFLAKSFYSAKKVKEILTNKNKFKNTPIVKHFILKKKINNKLIDKKYEEYSDEKIKNSQ